MKMHEVESLCDAIVARCARFSNAPTADDTVACAGALAGALEARGRFYWATIGAIGEALESEAA